MASESPTPHPLNPFYRGERSQVLSVSEPHFDLCASLNQPPSPESFKSVRYNPLAYILVSKLTGRGCVIIFSCPWAQCIIVRCSFPYSEESPWPNTAVVALGNQNKVNSSTPGKRNFRSFIQLNPRKNQKTPIISLHIFLKAFYLFDKHLEIRALSYE